MSGMDPASWITLKGSPFETLPLFATSLAIGLLMGVERERKRHVLAGIRTFPLACLLGTLAAMLDGVGNLPLLQTAGFIAVSLFGFLPEHNGHSEPNEPREPRTTTIVALLVAYCLGALVWRDMGGLAVALGIVTTSLLYLKPELTGFSHKLDRRDLLSLLQFAALSSIVLPLLPNRAFGPYQALNPHHIWLMVTLIVGIGLVGYLAVKILGQRIGGPLLGLMGGLVSSTATTLVYAREARTNPASANLAASVILLANLVLFARLTLLAAVIDLAALPSVAAIMLPALLAGLAASLWQTRQAGAGQNQPELTLSNPSELKIAIGFGLMFGLVMFCAAWLNAEFGSKGVYVVALISGINDVDAITLTSLNLFAEGRLDGQQVATAVALAVLANNIFKFSLMATLGGKALARRCLPTLLLATSAMLIALAALLAGH